MSLQVTPSLADSLPSSVKQGLAKLPPETQATFEEEYSRGKKSSSLMVILSIFLPIQHFLLGRTGLGIAFWLTFGGCGIWYLIEIFLAHPRTKKFNEDVAKRTLRDIKIMNS